MIEGDGEASVPKPLPPNQSVLLVVGGTGGMVGGYGCVGDVGGLQLVWRGLFNSCRSIWLRLCLAGPAAGLDGPANSASGLTVVSALSKAWCVNCFSCSTCSMKLTLK